MFVLNCLFFSPSVATLMYIRYKQIEQHYRDHLSSEFTVVLRINKGALLIGWLGCFGVCILANFQVCIMFNSLLRQFSNEIPFPTQQNFPTHSLTLFFNIKELYLQALYLQLLKWFVIVNSFTFQDKWMMFWFIISDCCFRKAVFFPIHMLSHLKILLKRPL